MKELLKKLLRFDLMMLVWLGALFIYYNFDALLPLQPQSVHHWRQSDCASFAWNYYATTWNFFEAHFNNLGWRGDGKAALEFPIIYYVVGMIWRVAGPHPWIFRLINILIVFAGLWAYARLIRLLVKDNFWPIFVSGLLFTSPVMVYYTVNFLPDVPAIAVSFIGWHCLLLYSEHGRHKSFVWALVWFTLAALLKAPAGLGLMSAFALYFIEWNGWFRFRGKKGLFPGKPLHIFPASTSSTTCSDPTPTTC